MEHKMDTTEITNTEEKNDVNVLLEEYKTLREESLIYISSSNQLYTFVFTAVSAIFVIATSNKENFYFYLLSFVILITARCKVIYYHEMNTRIAEYISHFIESRLSGLNWESRAKRKYEKIITKESADIVSELHYFSYSILGGISYILFYINGGGDISLFLRICCFLPEILLLYCDSVIRFGNPVIRKKYRKEWIDKE